MDDEQRGQGTDTVTCYRHPDREAPLRCVRCERPICVQDAVDAPVGFLCPDDARQAPRARRAYAAAARATEARSTRVLLGSIVVAYLLQQVAPGVTRDLLTFGPAVAAGEWWRVVTGGFLHGSLLHIGFNGYLLWQLGQMLEGSEGTGRFAGLYAAGLAGGGLGVMLLGWDQPTLGASGAVFGLMGAAMVLLRRRGINPWQTSIGTLVLLNLGLTFVVPSISIGGHLGGFVLGAAAAALAAQLDHAGERRRGTAAVWGLAAGALAVAIWLGVVGPVLEMGSLTPFG